jgi:hypothetical protein
VVATWRKGDLDGRFERFYEKRRSELAAGYNKGVDVGKFTCNIEGGEWMLKAAHKAGLLDGSLRVKDPDKTISQQNWNEGFPVKINGIAPFPRSLKNPRPEALRHPRRARAKNRHPFQCHRNRNQGHFAQATGLSRPLRSALQRNGH